MPVRPPELAASKRRGEVTDVVPEPKENPAEFLALRVDVDVGERELDSVEDPGLVVQNPMRAHGDRPHVARPEEEQLELDAVGEDHERDVLVAEVLDEERI